MPAKRAEGTQQLAVFGDNCNILVFATEKLTEMPRGKGVKLQSYCEGGLRDDMSFSASRALAGSPSTVASAAFLRQVNGWPSARGEHVNAERLRDQKVRSGNARFRITSS